MRENSVFRKTPKGVDEVERRVYRLAVKERLLLILVDGKRSLREISGRELDWGEVAARLVAQGYIEIVPQAGAAPAPVARPSAPPVARPSAPPVAKPSAPPAARPPARPEETSPAPARNWLTNTMSQLTGFFASGLQEPPPPRRPPQPRREDDIIDITGNLSPTRLKDIRAAADYSVMDLDEEEVEPVPDPTAGASAGATTAPVGASRVAFPKTWDEVPCIDLDGQLEPPGAKAADPVPATRPTPADMAAPRRPADASRSPPATSPPPREAMAAEPGKYPCCTHCPGKSVLTAREFMKRHVSRLPGHPHGSAILERLDQCRSVADLEEQIEPWLRVLLTSPAGIAEVPRLSSQLIRILRQ